MDIGMRSLASPTITISFHSIANGEPINKLRRILFKVRAIRAKIIY